MEDGGLSARFESGELRLVPAGRVRTIRTDVRTATDRLLFATVVPTHFATGMSEPGLSLMALAIGRLFIDAPKKIDEAVGVASPVDLTLTHPLMERIAALRKAFQAVRDELAPRLHGGPLWADLRVVDGLAADALRADDERIA